MPLFLGLVLTNYTEQKTNPMKYFNYDKNFS